MTGPLTLICECIVHTFTCGELSSRHLHLRVDAATDLNIFRWTQQISSIQLHVVAEFLRKSVFGDFQIFVASGQGKRATLIGTIHFFIGYLEDAKFLPNKNFNKSRSSHKIVRKLAYLGVEMMSLHQKHKIVIKVANISVTKLCT